MGLLVTSAVVAVALATAAPWPTTKIVSWWVVVDDSWPDVIKQISPHVGNATVPSLVTSIQSDCGYTVTAAGAIGGSFSPACAAFFPAAAALGVRNELWLDGGNCDIVAYRTLWADTVASPQVLLRAALAANATGWNVDLEPQADACQGAPTGTPADATAFAAWLAAVRAALNPHGIRLTVDVASWSPVLSQFATLAPAVDRLQNMETYNGDSAAQWTAWYKAFVGAVPRASAGVGLGAWSDGAGAWWETQAGAAFKVNRSRADGVPELAVFRLLPGSAWPLPFWWATLAAFVAP